MRLTIQPPRGPARDVSVTRALVATRYVAESHRLAVDPTVGYLRIPSFFVFDMAAQVEQQLRALLADPRPLRALVIDVRANPGGFVAVTDAITGQFVAGNAGRYVDRAGASTLHVVQAGDLKTRLDTTAIVVLTDADSASSSEFFAAILQSQGRAKVVGARTAGVTESTELFDGPGGLRVAVPVQATLLPNGVNLEGKGVTPDVTVDADWTRFDEASDPDILAAVALLKGGRD